MRRSVKRFSVFYSRLFERLDLSRRIKSHDEGPTIAF